MDYTASKTEPSKIQEAEGPVPRMDALIRRNAPNLIGLLSVLVASLLIAHTYKVFSQTFDECIHVVCGLEWLDRGTYLIESLHPPLARVAGAVLPYLAGVRDPGISDMWENGNALLNWNGQYERNLMLARLGILPFFWLACFLVWHFMARHFGCWYGAVAVFFLAFCPVVLGHAALATTDAALVAMFLWSVLAFWAFLETPKTSTALMAGFVLGLGILTKFTEIPFIFLAGGALVLCAWIIKRHFPVNLKLISLAFVTSLLTIWAGYRFEIGPIVHRERLTPTGVSLLNGLSPFKRKRALRRNL